MVTVRIWARGLFNNVVQVGAGQQNPKLVLQKIVQLTVKKHNFHEAETPTTLHGHDQAKQQFTLICSEDNLVAIEFWRIQRLW